MANGGVGGGFGAPDVVVIGAGIVGASVAYALARGGARVVVLDAGTPGAGTSGTSFAWLNSVRKEPEAYHRLNASSMAAYRELAQELGDDLGVHPGGSLEWAESPESRRALSDQVDRLASWGYAASFIGRERALEMEPHLDIPRTVPDVAFYADDAWLDAPRAVRCLLDAAVARGAVVRPATPVRSFNRQGRRIEKLGTASGEVVASSVVVCTGPATAAVLAPLGVDMPVGRVPGLLAVTSRPPSPLGRVVHAPGVHVRPDASGGLLIGATDLDALVNETTPPGSLMEEAKPLLDRAARAFPPARQVRLVEARVGVRPMPSDGHTIAGRLPQLDNAWVVVTHSGVTLGALLGGLIADEVLGKPASPDLAPFRPDRFSTR